MPLLVVLTCTLAFGRLNVLNSTTGAPQWGQDLAFFHPWVHSAATGGPWASPLILEPQGFFEQVHTHLIMPVVVTAYRLFPVQETLLWLHSLGAALVLWPVYRLGERIAGGRHAIMCCLAITMFGPFQAVATADFRPVVLFLPGIVGLWTSAHRGSTLGCLVWGLVALSGRQEASYLIAASGIAMLFLRWGGCTRRLALVVIILGGISWVFFAAMKPQMFFHINPLAPNPWPDSSELWSQRSRFGLALLASGWWLGLLRPAPLLAAAPVVYGMLATSREWHALAGPGAHHHAFWLPFLVVAGVAGSARIKREFGPLFLVLGGLFSFPWVAKTAGLESTVRLVERVPSDAAIAADYETIHRLAGRKVLWNVDQLYMEDRPYHWTEAWPLTVSDVDWVLAPSDHSVSRFLERWTVVAETETHTLWTRGP